MRKVHFPLPHRSGAGRLRIKKSAKILNILTITSLLLTYFTPLLPFIKEAKADSFYPDGDNADCHFASTVAVGYDDVGNGVNYDPAQISGYSRAWIDSARFTDVATPYAPDAHRYAGIADGVAVPPNTRVSVAFYAWNYTGHNVNVSQVDLFLSKQNQGGGVSNLGGGGSYGSTSWKIGNVMYTRNGMKTSAYGVGNYADRGNDNGRIIHDFYTIQPITRQNFTATPIWSGANLSIRYDLTLRNNSNYNLCNIRVRDTMPSGQTYDNTVCINAGQTSTISYTENWGTSYPMSITNNNVRVDDNNTLHEDTAEAMTWSGDNRVETKTSVPFRNDSTNTGWYAPQASWGMQGGELFDVTLIPYWFEGGSASVNLTQNATIIKTVSDSNENNVTHNTAQNRENLTYRVTVTNTDARVTGMRVIDDYDQNYVTITNSGGGVDNGDTITWSNITLEHGESRTFTINAKIKNLAQGSYTFVNRAWTESPNESPVETITDVFPKVVIPLSKTVSDSDESNVKVNSIQGDHFNEDERKVHFNITYSNTGDTEAHNVVLTDNLTQFASLLNRVENISNGGTYDSNTHVITWNLGLLSDGASGSQSFDLYLNRVADSDKSIVNQTTIVSNETQPVSDTTTTNVLTPKIVISKTDGVNTANTGDTLHYTITIRNTGTGNAYNLIIKDTLPDYLINPTNISDSGVYDNGTRIITWQSGNIGEYSLLSGTSRNFTYEATIPDIMPVGTTTLTNRATVESPTISPIETTDTTDVTALPENDIKKYVVNLTATEQGRGNSGENVDNEYGADANSWYANNKDVITVAGDRILYTIVYRNTGNANSPETFVADHLPRYIKDVNGNQYEIIRSEDFESVDEGLTPVANGSGWDIVWDVGTLEVGQEYSIKQFTVRINPSESVTFSYDDTSRLIDNLSEIYSSNNLIERKEDNAIIRVDQPVAEITKGADKVIYQSNEEVIYTIEVTNNGSHKAEGIVKDTIPEGLSFKSSTPNISRINGQQVEWDLSLEIGETKTITVRVTFNTPVTDGRFFNNQVIYDYTDINKNERPDVSDNVDVQVIAPQFKIEKIALEPDPITPTNDITYQVTLTNYGAGTAFNVHIKDTISSKLEVLTDSISDGGIYDSSTRTITWTMPKLESNKSVVRTFKARILFGEGVKDGDVIQNKATADSDTSVTVETEVVSSEINCGYLEGIVWEDSNKNAIIDKGELRIPNASIVVTVEDFENFGAKFVSDKEGHYVATCLPYEKNLYVDIIRPTGYAGQTTVDNYVVKLSQSNETVIYKLSEDNNLLYVWSGGSFSHADLGLFRSYAGGSVLGISTVATTGGIAFMQNLLIPAVVTLGIGTVKIVNDKRRKKICGK